MKRIVDISNLNLPVFVLEDVNKRITDWLASGGKEEDDYIQRQIIYAEKYATYMQNKTISNNELKQ